MRAASLRQALRPDFFEWWPRFDPAELELRLQRLDVARATLLTVDNLWTLRHTWPDAFDMWREQFVRLDWEQKARIGAELLRGVGIAEPVCAAHERVNRAAFLPERSRALAFVNASAPLSTASNATLFGLNAIVTETVLKICPTRIIEVGFGSGALAALICETIGPSLGYIGYEPDTTLQPLWRNGCDSSPAVARAQVRWQPFDAQYFALEPGDLLLFSCAPPAALRRAVLHVLRLARDASVVMPWPLSRPMFDRHAKGLLRWRGQAIERYEDYLADPRAYMLLEYSRGLGGRVERQRVCTNLQYVAWRRSGDDSPIREESYRALELIASSTADRLKRDCTARR